MVSTQTSPRKFSKAISHSQAVQIVSLVTARTSDSVSKSVTAYEARVTDGRTS